MKWLKKMFERIYTPKTLMKAARRARFPHEKMQVSKRQTRYTYTDGPMYFLGQQIVKVMEDAGYPATIFECYRSPERQTELQGNDEWRTDAGAFNSAHQYFEAVDIVHPSLFWKASSDYWEQLAIAVRIVADKFDVDLNHGHHWPKVDSAHIQLRDWRQFKAVVGISKPTPQQLADRFAQVLPRDWAQYLRRK